MEKTFSKIAIFDWGIGGLSVLKPLMKQKSKSQFFYFSDSGFTPYGKLSAKEMQDRLELLFDHALKIHKMDALIIACNAASTSFIGKGFHQEVPLFDVIEPVANFLKESSYKNIGVIGGDLTTKTNIYHKLISRKNIIARSAQPLSALVEEGVLTGDKLESIARDLLCDYVNSSIDSLVLACTHYPALSSVISKILPGVDLIDPADYLIEKISLDLSSCQDCKVTYFTTGSKEETQSSAQLAFGVEIEGITELML